MAKTRTPTPSQKRRQFEEPRQGSRTPLWLVISALAILGLALYFALPGTPAARPAAPADAVVLPAGQDARLPVSLFTDGSARFYRYTTSIGREVRLFVMRSSDGVVRAAFDACDVCFRARKGYRQAGDSMLCVNCGQTFRSSNINVMSGGCNPAPIERSTDGAHVVLKAADLDLGAVYF